MPIDYKNYPPNWKTEIRPRILARAGNCCERCKVPNYKVILRGLWEVKGEIIPVYQDDDTGKIYSAIDGTHLGDDYVGEVWQFGAKQTITRVILTIAHVGQDKSPMNAKEEDLLALCQRCHLLEDKEHHATKRRETINRKKKQIDLFETTKTKNNEK